MGYIYKITNTVNGSCYVGMTKGAIDKRLSEAMLEYGTSNFIIESIAESSNLTELIGLESQYIRSLGTLHPNGYNLTTAGNDCKVSDITKSKISDAMTGRDVTWGDKVSQSVKELWKSSGYRKKQDESRKKIRGKYKPDIKRPPKVSITTEDVESMLNAGYTINQIAVHYGVAFSTIKKRTVK